MAYKPKGWHILIDGYNLIFSWPKLKKLCDDSMSSARDKLIDHLTNYQAACGYQVTVVFDGHKVPGNLGDISVHVGVNVIFTKENETADNLIESLCAVFSRTAFVRVVTSDYIEQIVSFGKGAVRMSAAEFVREIADQQQYLRKTFIEQRPVKRNLLLDNLDEHTAKLLEDMRHNRTKEEPP